jgi:two-component system, NarL family, nitrate/nitrite response regulator NarL
MGRSTNRQTDARRPVDEITEREWQVIAGVKQGMTNREIGRSLDPPIPEQSVKNRMRSILLKVGVTNRVELALWAITHGQGASDSH